MPDETGSAGPGATLGTPAAEGATPPTTAPAGAEEAREAPSSSDGVRDGEREAGVPTDEEGWRKAINTERSRRREAEKALRESQAAVRDRERAGMSEIERVTVERDEAVGQRDELRTRLEVIERETLARRIAVEIGIPEWWDKLSGGNERELREDAAAIRERLGLGRGSMDAGTRTIGATPQPRDMNDLIRRKAGRARG